MDLHTCSAQASERLVNPTCMSKNNLVSLSVDTKLSVASVAAVLTALSWVLLGGARDQLDHSTLQYELLQLGTPKEHAGAVARVYKERRTQLITATRRDSLRLSSLVGVEWRVDNQVRLLEGEIEVDKVVRLDVEVGYSRGKKENR